MREVASVEELSSSIGTELYAYWELKRGERLMPSRADIDPADLKRILPNIILARIDRESKRVRYTLVGTRCVAQAAMDYTNYYLDELDFVSEIGTDWPAVYRAIAAEKAPIYGLCQIKFTDGVVKPYVCAMFPLSSDGERVDQVLAIEDLELDLLEVERLPASELMPPKP